MLVAYRVIDIHDHQAATIRHLFMCKFFPMWILVFSNYSGFLHYFIMAKLATSSIRVKQDNKKGTKENNNRGFVMNP